MKVSGSTFAIVNSSAENSDQSTANSTINSVDKKTYEKSNFSRESSSAMTLLRARNDVLKIFGLVAPKELLLSEAAIAKSGFIPNTEIPSNAKAITTLLGTGTLINAPIQAEDALGNIGQFSILKNGFEFRKVPLECMPILGRLVANPGDAAAREEFRNTFAPYVETLAKNTWGYADTVRAIPLDAVIRDTKPLASGAFGAVGLVHIDFPENLSQTVPHFADTWGPRLANKGVNEKSATYPGMVNVWMPLDNHVKADPLIVVDKNIPSGQKSKIYDAVRRDGSKFQAQVLEDNTRPVNAHYLSSFGKGDCVIFDSTKTPHSSVEMPGQGNQGRRSLEVRVLFVDAATV